VFGSVEQQQLKIQRQSKKITKQGMVLRNNKRVQGFESVTGIELIITNSITSINGANHHGVIKRKKLM
jgi:hypothetical protein